MSDHVTDIVCAHSPDSDDAFMFYGLATRKVRSEFIQLRHVLEDIETLNRKALQGAYELTAISYHAYPYVADKYVLMASGSSIGDNYGPMLVSLQKIDPREVKGKKIAIPGLMTTAYLALRLFEPDFEAVVIPFDQILNAVAEKTVDLGLIIHEGQLTYGKAGFHKIVDLGVWWKQQHNIPLPLGANALRRDLEPRVATEVCRLMRDSIAYALEHREQAVEYAMQFARDMDHTLADKFIGMYVNHYTVDAGEIIPRAAQKLLDLGFEAGLVKNRVALEFVR